MLPNDLPSVRALVAADDQMLQEELRCLAVRRQAAVLRALSDELERVRPGRPTLDLRGQLVEELTRLARDVLETITTLSRGTGGRDSGILPVGSAE
jgi:hypothetical protein